MYRDILYTDIGGRERKTTPLIQRLPPAPHELIKGRCMSVPERLSEEVRQRVLAEYAMLGTYAATARAVGISARSVGRIIRQEMADGGKAYAFAVKKKAQQAATIEAYMEDQLTKVQAIIGLGLDVLSDPVKMRSAQVSQITVAIGTLIDKWRSPAKSLDGEGGGVVELPQVQELTPPDDAEGSHAE